MDFENWEQGAPETFNLGDELFNHREEVLTEILKLVVTIIPQQRGQSGD
jgi:hypothetical protein